MFLDYISVQFQLAIYQEILSYLRGERIICSCAAMRDATCVFDGGQKAGC